MFHVKPYFNKITQSGYDLIEQEIQALKKTRPAKIKALQAARALGDLSENTEYSSAKRDLRHLESRLRYLGKQLRYAQIVTPQDNTTVEIGKDVVLEFLDDHTQATYHLVGQPEANLEQQKVTAVSPLGKALLGHHPDDVVSIAAPAGRYQVKIISVTLS